MRALAVAAAGVVACYSQAEGIADDESSTSVAPVAARSLSLEDAMGMASTDTDDIEVAREALAFALAQVASARSAWWPQVFGSVSYVRTIKSQFEGVFPDTGAQDLPFGRRDTWTAGLTLAHTIWNFGATRARVEGAEAARKQAVIALSSAGAASALAAASVYLDAQLAEELIAIARRTLAQATQTLKVAELGFANGTMAEFDVLRAKVNRDNQRMVLMQRRSAARIARLSVKRALALPLETDLRLTTPLEDAAMQRATRTPSAGSSEPLRESEAQAKERAFVRSAALELRQARAQGDIARAQRLPTLSLSGNFGFVNYPENPLPSIHADDWLPNWSVGVSLSVPIFEGFAGRARIASARAAAGQARATLASRTREAAIEVVQARENIALAREQWMQSARTSELARRAYQIATTRFEQEVATQLDLIEARIALDQANVNRAQAARDLQVAQIRWALLPRLPRQTGGGAELPPAAVSPFPANSSARDRAATRARAPGVPPQATAVPVSGASGLDFPGGR